jgi:hypothetical protein
MRPRTLVVAVLVALPLVACTGDPEPSTPPTSAASPTDSPIPEGPVSFVPGEFATDVSNVAVALTWDGGAGEMTVENGSSSELGQAGLTAITDEPAEVDATLEGPATIAVGETATFEVTFPESLAPAEAGLLLLSFGGDSWGALSPVVAEG